MPLLRVLRAVLWSFFGIRRGADAARDLQEARPRTIIAAGALLAAILIALVVTVVRFVVPHRAEERKKEALSVAQVAQPPTLHGPVVVRDTMEERVAPCTTCHGSETQATKDGFSPRIAGKPAGYLFNQLVSFRDGRRTYPPMVYLVQYMTDGYLREMAEDFARLELPYPPPEAAALPDAAQARARRIVEHGDPQRDVPACVACHGARLSGTQPAIPAVLGLPRQYLNAQFGAWRNGRLRSVAPDCMAEVARRLAQEDISLLASWLAAQPVPADMKPAPAPRELPLECGAVDIAQQVSRPSAGKRPISVEKGRGEYLVTAGDCIACHTAVGGAPFAGGRAIETPFGTAYSSNITPDAATGIGAWSADDFWRALHDGRSRDGRLLYPAFPYPSFTKVTREDADAMYGYLRTLPAVERPNTPHRLRFPYSTQAALAAWRALFFRPGIFESQRDRGAEWNRGAYLVRGLGHCDACHAGRNIFGAVSHSLDLGGGLIPMQNWYAPPLAPGAWEAAHVVELLRTGASPRGMAMGPMAEVVYRSTQYLEQQDRRAIAAYLESVKPPPRARPQAMADPRALARGGEVYQEHCAQCHGDDGEGAFPAYPALAGNPSMAGALAANAIKAVLNGGYAPATSANPRPYGMPPYFSRLGDDDIAAVLTYARASWGNRGAPVSALDVERFR
ncbi:MAG TPA: c-type cytochrome [Burkholderiales bacterium]|nr:c-type cytochrome [Burkholderiales bacterium]